MHRTRFSFAIVLALLVVAALAGAAFGKNDAAGGRTITTALSGANEVNAAGVPNQGDLGGSGTASITVNRGQGTICWTMTYDLSASQTSIAAHIHAAPAGSNGPVVVPLSIAIPDGTTSGCAAVDPALILEILTDPAAFYVNVHSSPTYAAGALRGQLG